MIGDKTKEFWDGAWSVFSTIVIIGVFVIIFWMIEEDKTRIEDLTARVNNLETRILKMQYETDEIKLLREIARCESGNDINAIKQVVDRGWDVGLFQINTYYHGERAKKIGLDLFNPEHNVRYAMALYAEQGTKPWMASEKCWGEWNE